MRRRLPFAAMLALPLAAATCTNVEDDVSSSASLALGDALPGTNATDFAEAKAAFSTSENAADGLGPIFNERGCGTCHQNGAVGGAGQQIEQRYGTLTNGVFDPLANTGGSLRQLFGIGGFNVGGVNCNSGTDANPAAGATIFAGRLTTPVFGLGLVDSLPDSRFDTLASREPTAVRGIVNRVTIAMANPADPGQSNGATRVGRFGWKAGVPNLGQFSGDAYLNEMGITTTSCNRGVVNRTFATENRANRAPTNAVINGCPDDMVPGTDDDLAEETNNCAGSLTEVQDDVANFAFFMRELAAPPRGLDNSNGRGLTEFNREGCNGCHVTTTFTVTINGRSVSFQPFSDFLKHDMGSLSDGIGNDGDSV
ncbi:MAG TPA: di-heme oxidoredictase family protein, partial [Polyangia bacterium]|nr:di-heme oxidoredictase family protein [Polyangia bacterium]